MTKDVGNLIGSSLNATTTSAKAVWNLFDQIRYKRTNDWPVTPQSIVATGGNQVVTPGNGYKYHTFTSPGSFVVTQEGLGDIMIVAGGGAAGGGGGGAGGLRYLPNTLIPIGTYPVTVGAGGVGQDPIASGNPGASSSFGATTSTGGGGGGRTNAPAQPGKPGGSGGGGGGWSSGVFATGGSGTPGQGNPGGAGSGFGPAYGAGGGGGAGASGTSGTTAGSGPGGVGLQYPGHTGSLIGVPALAPLAGYFAGGGGGGSAGGSLGAGGAGGGGSANYYIAIPGVTNSGGGAGAFTGNGGPGIVIIRYLI